ncbi:actin cytoskeleton-regulatory complex protein PAN1 isoform X2 [Drosophila eugracilis]|uniref:actin cytoskeleton-regulatory complex protein PAN1 isoform X2 n=2 Tax=Drosophila eugracilis TaxID=29029 RepID=UPI001BDB2171|nr:actin cytoskeleton-regulatory complex protein PAN1 isoform X2 [Drosophila eugracilis]
MQVSTDVFAHPPPAVRPPPYYADNVSINASLDGMKSSSSSNSLDRYVGAPPSVALAGPSFATSVLVSNKGSKYEISGPVNFQHVSGDVTRDRTRNAFDLNGDCNDNVLRKYMIERGITDADISHMKRQDVIKKIVHSNFTWMPSKGDIQAQQKVQETVRPLLYATISTNNQITPPPSPPPPTTDTVSKATAAPFSNYASLTSRFVDISDIDLPAPIQAASTPFRQPEMGTVIPVQVQPQQMSRPKVPPPPSAVMAKNTHGYPAAINVRQVRPVAPTKVSNETYATISPQRKVGSMRIPPPAPPKPTVVPNTNSIVSNGSLYAVSPVQYAPVAKPEPVVKPTPPAPPAKPTSRISAAYVTPLPAHSTRFTAAGPAPVPPPPPQAAPPPPPPPMPVASSGGPPPPPPPPPGGLAGVPPPPPMQKSQQKAAPAATSGGDSRDAFLESIRQGVTLKKVDQKAATISGIKPRPERKPVTGDFLSELKLGITLRRVKNPADNPYSEESESQA